MFPFTLDGPAFLAFYAALAAGVLVSLGLYLRGRGGAVDAAALMPALSADPYRIACLRSGPAEAVRVALVAAVDRGWVQAGDDETVAITAAGRSAQSPVPLERAVLQVLRAGAKPADAVLGDAGVQRAAAEIESALARQGLLLGPAERSARGRARGLALLLLLGVAAARVVQTLLAGRSNLVFLLLITGVALVVAAALGRGRLTAAGRRALSSLKTLLGEVKRRAPGLKPGTASRDVALAAALFGLAVLPAAAFGFAHRMAPPPGSTGSSDTGGSDGGSSSNDGGGGDSGCGGSGCGGGSSD